MIYFDKVYKLAHTNEIPNPLCIIKNEVWSEFCFLKLGKDYDITADGIVDLRVTPEYIAEVFARKKQEKHAENQRKLDIARTSHVFTVTLQDQECVFDTKDKTQSDLNSAAISASIGQPWLWTTNNRITLSLTSEDILAVSSAYAQAVNADIAKWTEYETLIEQTQSIEELNNIEIDYE